MKGAARMTDIIVVAVVAVIIALAAGYIVKAKKSGKKCIGCPDCSCCPSSESGSCSCGCSSEKK